MIGIPSSTKKRHCKGVKDSGQSNSIESGSVLWHFECQCEVNCIAACAATDWLGEGSSQQRACCSEQPCNNDYDADVNTQKSS